MLRMTTETSTRKKVQFENLHCFLTARLSDWSVITATKSLDPFFHEVWTSKTRKGSAFHSAGHRDSPFQCTSIYLCSPYCTYTYKLAERSSVSQKGEGGGGQTARGNSPPPTTGDGRLRLVSHYPAICLVSIFTAPFPTRIVFFSGCWSTVYEGFRRINGSYPNCTVEQAANLETLLSCSCCSLKWRSILNLLV
jgi:hypothetical protein